MFSRSYVCSHVCIVCNHPLINRTETYESTFIPRPRVTAYIDTWYSLSLTYIRTFDFVLELKREKIRISTFEDIFVFTDQGIHFISLRHQTATRFLSHCWKTIIYYWYFMSNLAFETELSHYSLPSTDYRQKRRSKHK
jgi:hypothetical protein